MGSVAFDGQRPRKPEPGSSPHWPAAERRIIADILLEFQLTDMNPTCLNDSSDKDAPHTAPLFLLYSLIHSFMYLFLFIHLFTFSSTLLPSVPHV